MKDVFRVLLIEDNDQLIDKIKDELDRLSLDFKYIVHTDETKIYDYLSDQRPDIIISDYNLADCDVLDVLSKSREVLPKVPFVLVSALIGEEKAVDAMLKGASDFVSKENLKRLGPAVQRELSNYIDYKKTKGERDQLKGDLAERVKEQQCLYSISSLKEQELSADQLLSRAVGIIPSGFQFPDRLEAEIRYNNEVFQTDAFNFNDSSQQLSKTVELKKWGEITARVVLADGPPKNLEDSFLFEEEKLLEAITHILAQKINQIQIDEELKRQQDYLTDAYNVAQIGHWELDLNTETLVWSDMVKKIHEVPLDYEATLDSAIAFYQGEDRDKIEKLVAKITEKGGSYIEDLRIITAKGNTRWIRVTGHAMLSDIQKPRLFGTTQNITDQKKAEQELLESRNKLQRAERVAKIGYWELDVSDNSIHASDGAKAIYGLPTKSINYETVKDFALEEYRPMLNRKMEQLITDNEPYSVDFKIINPEEKEFHWIHSVAEYDSDREVVFGIIQDITRQKRVEAKLRKSEQRYQSLFKKNHAVMLLIDPQKNEILDANPAAEQLYGYPVDQLCGMSVHDINTLSPEEVKKEMAKVVSERKKYFEFKHRLANGEIRDVVVYSGPIRMGNEDLLYSIIFDNSERKKVEKELRKLSAATEQSPALIMITDQEGIIEYVNPKFTEVTGYSRTELIGKNPRIFKSGKQSEKFYKRFWNTIKKGDVFRGEFTNKKKNGELYQVLTSVAPIKNEDGEVTNFVAVQEDITERKKNERRLQKSLEEKKALLGEIHHRVKNNLAVVSGIMQLKAMTEQNISTKETLNDSVSRIQSMATIHELLYQSKSFSSLDFADAIKEVAQSVLENYQHDMEIDLNFHITTDNLNINQALPTALVVNEVVTNVIKHAFNGRKEGRIDISVSEQNNIIKLGIADDGHPLPEAFKPNKENRSLGIKLIDTLTQQLEGEYNYVRKSNGTVFELDFQKRDIKGVGNANL